MIRIGIVDDEKQERDQLKQALARFSAENGTELNVQEFDCAAVYLAAQDLSLIHISEPTRRS